MALHLAEDIHHNLGQTAVVPAGGQGVHQQGKRAVLCQVLIPAVQQLLQHLGHEDAALPLVAQAEVRVQVQQVAALPKQGGAEGVDGGNLRLVDQGGLAAEVAVVGRLSQPVGQLLSNAATKLCRRRLGVCNHQEAVDVQPLPGHPVQQPFHQHTGLARPRRRRYQQLPAPVVYNLSLFFCQWKGHGTASFTPSKCSNTFRCGCRCFAPPHPAP